jgi:hypothetical protein
MIGQKEIKTKSKRYLNWENDLVLFKSWKHIELQEQI